MQIKEVPISEVTPYERNAKKHPQDQIEHIANSLKRFGWKQPLVVDKDGVVVVGHGRLLAARKLGYEKVPVLYADDLTEDEIKAFRLADNKTNESAWDDELLDLELDEIEDINMGEFGFSRGLDVSEEEGAIIEDDYEVKLPEEPKSKRGDIYQLGEHRLMCGDSTVMADVGKLVCENDIDLVVTDPPYNMNYEGGGGTKDRKEKRIIGDHMPKAQFKTFLESAFRCYEDVMKDGATIYCFYKELGEGVFITAMKDAGLTFKQELIWVKDQLVLGGAKYQNIYEPFLMGCKGKSIKKWNGGRKQRSVIESFEFMDEEELRNTIKELIDGLDADILREKKQLRNDLHPTMKPVRLIARLIKNSSNIGDCICDLFGGSGTTVIAAEQLGRKAYIMEIDPKFCDVIVDRWETFTGKKAVLLNE